MIIPLIIAGIVVGTMFLAGCDDSEEEDNPGGIPEDTGVPFKGPTAGPDVFVKPEALQRFDDISYTTMKYSLPESLITNSTPAWQPRARLYFGATEELFKPIHEKRESEHLDPKIKSYVDAMVDFFDNHYDVADAGRSLAYEDGVLVLIGGLAPTKPGEAVTVGAIEMLGSEAEGQGEFVRVLKAGYHYNKAAEIAGVTDRFTSVPKVAAGITATERDEALAHLQTAHDLISGIDAQEPAELDDRQVEFLILREAARGLKESLEQIKDNPAIGKKRKKKKTPKERVFGATNPWGKKATN